jgi:hypothetical protein
LAEPAVFSSGLFLDLIEERQSVFPSVLVERLMLAGSIIVVLCYTWLAANTLEPKFEAPKNVASELVWLSGGQAREWREVQAYKQQSSERINVALGELSRVIPVIGGFRLAPEIVIDADHQDRYTIGDERILLSENIAAADGQLVKALLKVWLLQRAGPEYTASLLRIEVVSDLLTGMLFHTDSFGLPGDRGAVSFPPTPEGWIGFAKSYEAACESPWKSLELQGPCGNSQALNALSFRPLLDGIVWSVFENVSTFKRYEFLRSWSKALRAQTTVTDASTEIAAVRRESPRTLVEWRDWLARELLLLVPMESTRPALEAAAGRAGLQKSVAVSMVIHRAGPDLVLENIQTALPGRVHDSFIVSFENNQGSDRKDDQWLVTGAAFGQPASWVRLEADELSEIEAPLFVFQSCRPTTLSTLISFPVKSERLLYVQACTGHPSDGWKSLLVDGLKGFARAEPDFPFLQLQRSQLAFALERGQLELQAPLASYMQKTPVGTRGLLGLSTAEWRRDMLAYRVVGAIEAVEWFRSPPAQSL